MIFGRKIFHFIFLIAFLPIIALADEIPSITITEKTNPKIAELYQRLQNAQEKIDQIQSERIDKLSENYEALKENEQSLENRTLTAATTAATGIGGMELAMGLSEQKADKDAEQDMMAYMETFRCEYGGGKSVKGGTTEIQLPADTLFDLYQEYITLAANLKERKEMLGLAPGIESDVIIDKATAGLYDDTVSEKTNGTYASIYRAKMGNETDQAKLQEMSDTSGKRVKGGAIAAGVGVIGGVVGNAIINKDAPKNESDKINREYDKKVEEATKEQEGLAKQLNQAIAENATQVQNYNDQLQQHKDQIVTINQSPKNCQEFFADYISTVSNLSPIENETDSVPDVELPDISEQKTLLTQCTQCGNKGAVFDSETNNCSCPQDKPIEKDGKCVEKQIVETAEPVVGQEQKPVIEPESEQSAIEDIIKTIIDAFKNKAETLKETECTI